MFTLFPASVCQKFLTYADIMTKEAPQSGSVMVAFCDKALEKGKGRGSLKTVAAGNPSANEVASPSTVANGGKKRKRRESSNTATTT